MEPSTLRRLGTLCIAVGILGLACTVLVAGLVATGTSGPLRTFMVFIVPIQSVVNVVVGMTLRRQGTAVGR